MDKTELFKVGFGTMVVGDTVQGQQEKQQQVQRSAVEGFGEAVSVLWSPGVTHLL